MTIYCLQDYFQNHFGQDFEFVSWSTMKIINKKYILCPFLNKITPVWAILFWAKFQFFQSNDQLMRLFGFKKLWCISKITEIISWKNIGRNWRFTKNAIFALNFVAAVGKRFQMYSRFYVSHMMYFQVQLTNLESFTHRKSSQ